MFLVQINLKRNWKGTPIFDTDQGNFSRFETIQDPKPMCLCRDSLRIFSARLRENIVPRSFNRTGPFNLLIFCPKFWAVQVTQIDHMVPELEQNGFCILSDLLSGEGSPGFTNWIKMVASYRSIRSAERVSRGCLVVTRISPWSILSYGSVSLQLTENWVFGF